MRPRGAPRPRRRPPVHRDPQACPLPASRLSLLRTLNDPRPQPERRRGPRAPVHAAPGHQTRHRGRRRAPPRARRRARGQRLGHRAQRRPRRVRRVAPAPRRVGRRLLGPGGRPRQNRRRHRCVFFSSHAAAVRAGLITVSSRSQVLGTAFLEGWPLAWRSRAGTCSNVSLCRS